MYYNKILVDKYVEIIVSENFLLIFSIYKI